MAYSFESDDELLPAVAEGQNWILASLFNLIVVSDSLEQNIRGLEIARLITGKYPCRLFLIQTDETREKEFFQVQHSVQAIGSQSNRVCFDQITIEASPDTLKKSPFVILPKILPDLPVYILLGHDPTQDHILLPELQKYSSRIVFDSHQTDNLQNFAERMLGMISSSRCDFVDINWAKTKAWREVMSRVFETQEKLELLNQNKRIQITYCNPQGHGHTKPELQALYLQAWLSAQLGWNYVSTQKDESSMRFTYTYQNATFEVSLAAKDTESLAIGEIYAIEVLTQNDSHFLISHEGKLGQVTVHASSPERCEMPYSIFLNNYQKGTALINEILYQPPSEHYLSMLTMLKTQL